MHVSSTLSQRTDSTGQAPFLVTRDGKETFQGLVLRCRGRTHLTQRQLAERLNVSVRSVQAWECGLSYPSVESLQSLIVSFLEADGFLVGHEAIEAAALWGAAQQESPRLRPAFDAAWFAELLGLRPSDDDRVPRMQDWGDIPDVIGLQGRRTEVASVADWVLGSNARLVALLGMGGIGKTMLAARLARDLAPAFDRVYWRSVRSAPPLTLMDWLNGAIAFVSGDQVRAPGTETAGVQVLLELLRQHRCLLVLDNVEVLLAPGERVGRYRDGYAGYGTLLQLIGQAEHQSCLIFTSREAPSELAELRGERNGVFALELGGLGVAEGQALLRHKHLQGDEAAWTSLVARYGGNGLALKMVGDTIRQVFAGDVAAFLEATHSCVFGGIRRLLDEQFKRLSSVEQDILCWLAVERDAVTFGKLTACADSRYGRGVVLEALEALRRRSLIERSDALGGFTLQQVVLEYVSAWMAEQSSAYAAL